MCDIFFFISNNIDHCGSQSRIWSTVLCTSIKLAHHSWVLACCQWLIQVHLHTNIKVDSFMAYIPNENSKWKRIFFVFVKIDGEIVKIYGRPSFNENFFNLWEKSLGKTNGLSRHSIHDHGQSDWWFCKEIDKYPLKLCEKSAMKAQKQTERSHWMTPLL